MFLYVTARTAPSPASPPPRAFLLAATAAGPRRCPLLPTAARHPRRIQPQPASSFPRRMEPQYRLARRLRPRCHLQVAWFALALLHPLRSDPSAGAFAPCLQLGIHAPARPLALPLARSVHRLQHSRLRASSEPAEGAPVPHLASQTLVLGNLRSPLPSPGALRDGQASPLPNLYLVPLLKPAATDVAALAVDREARAGTPAPAAQLYETLALKLAHLGAVLLLNPELPPPQSADYLSARIPRTIRHILFSNKCPSPDLLSALSLSSPQPNILPELPCAPCLRAQLSASWTASQPP